MAKEDRSNRMSKVTSSSSPKWASGGPASGMASRTGVNTATCGDTVAQNHGMGAKWAEGGSGPMAPRTQAITQSPGRTHRS